MTANGGDILMMSTPVFVPPKRKDSMSPRALKRKFLRRVVVPSLSHLPATSKSISGQRTHEVSGSQPESLENNHSSRVPAKKKKASSPAMTDCKYHDQIVVPILAVNGECVGEKSVYSPGPEQAASQERSTHPLPHQSNSPMVLPKKCVSTSRFFKKKSVKTDVPVISNQTPEGEYVGSQTLLESFHKGSAQENGLHHTLAAAAENGDECLGVAPKKNEVSKDLRKRSFRNIIQPLIPHRKANVKCTSSESKGETRSAFEQELADQENQSPNDPEFMRRASQRWQRKTGVVNHQPFQYTKFEWPTSPTQQPAFQRRVSPQPVHYIPSPFMTPPTPPLTGTPFRRSNIQYSSMHERSTTPEESPFQRSVRSYSSMMLPNTCQKKNSCLHLSKTESCSEKSAKPKKSNLHVAFMQEPLSTEKKADSARVKWPPRLSLDDSVAEEVRKVARRESLLIARETPFRRLSVKIRKSLHGPKRKASQIVPSVTTTAVPTVTTSASYQSALFSLSGYPSTSSFYSASPPSSPLLSQGHLTLQDIFVAEPKIAEKFAIMFPTEPRPEWHRHLRHVIHKAGQKIFKKPEHHDTNIPDNLRYQLKYIYVY
ncbi:hypothetical protein OTU49_002963 [Cherax quadricarinatus]|uniref:Uncharacterized protein n=1 Tax=Cherax quadricarinatus TaxID=27406 RepID=A0AAW0XM62_CHEQU